MSGEKAETKTKKNPLSVILQVTGVLITAAALALCLLLALPRLFGISGYAVLTGSMEPALPVGSLVYARAVDQPESLAEGEIIVFYEGLGSTPVVHRLLENRVPERELVTKGDANSVADLMPVPYENLIGRDVLHLPFLGRLLSPLGTIGGKLSVLAMILGGLLLCSTAQRIRCAAE